MGFKNNKPQKILDQVITAAFKHTAKFLEQQKAEELRKERLKNSIVVECKKID